MARPLRLALFPEGPTDVRFFSPVLRRLTLDIDGLLPCDVPEQVLDLSTIEFQSSDRAGRIREAVEAADSAFDVLFIHADGASDPSTKRKEQVESCMTAVAEWLPRRAAVGLVPVREMEAWALVDGNAIRRVLGSTRTDEQLQLPKHSDRITDPKAKLDAVVREAHGSSRRRRARTGADYLQRLGDEVSLAELRHLAAFKGLETELRSALVNLGYVPH